MSLPPSDSDSVLQQFLAQNRRVRVCKRTVLTVQDNSTLATESMFRNGTIGSLLCVTRIRTAPPPPSPPFFSPPSSSKYVCTEPRTTQTHILFFFFAATFQAQTAVFTNNKPGNAACITGRIALIGFSRNILAQWWAAQQWVGTVALWAGLGLQPGKPCPTFQWSAAEYLESYLLVAGRIATLSARAAGW